MDAPRDQRKNVWQVPGFIQRRDDDAHSMHFLFSSREVNRSIRLLWDAGGADWHGDACQSTGACTLAHVTFGPFLRGRSGFAVFGCTSPGVGPSGVDREFGTDVERPQMPPGWGDVGQMY